jgi:hypothetical protein
MILTNMTQYYTTSYDTGTCGDYFNDRLYQNSTTTTSTGCNKWSYLHEISGTTSASTLYNRPHTGTAYNVSYLQNQLVSDKPSEQELLKRRVERIKAEEIANKAREDADIAAKKARLLLLEYLGNENSKRLLDRDPLEIPSKLFNDIKYHIPVSNGRIKAWKENKVVTELCLSVGESWHLPTDDIVLTKLLYVLHDEENMLRTANHSNIKENLLARLS